MIVPVFATWLAIISIADASPSWGAGRVDHFRVEVAYDGGPYLVLEDMVPPGAVVVDPGVLDGVETCYRTIAVGLIGASGPRVWEEAIGEPSCLTPHQLAPPETNVHVRYVPGIRLREAVQLQPVRPDGR